MFIDQSLSELHALKDTVCAEEPSLCCHCSRSNVLFPRKLPAQESLLSTDNERTQHTLKQQQAF